MSSTEDFIRTQQGIERGVSTGHALLDQAFLLPIGGSLLVKGEPHAGASAIAFEMTKRLRDMEIPTVFVDVADSWQKHRTADIDVGELAYIRPYSIGDLHTLAVGLRPLPRIAFVMDGPNLMADKSGTGFGSQGDLHHLARSIRRLYRGTECTIVYTQHERTQAQGMWNTVVSIEPRNHEYEDGVGVSHLLDVGGPLGRTTVMVEYRRGRLSKAYEQAALQHRQGVAKGGYFVDPETGERIRGFNEYVKQLNARLPGEGADE